MIENHARIPLGRLHDGYPMRVLAEGGLTEAQEDVGVELQFGQPTHAFVHLAPLWCQAHLAVHAREHEQHEESTVAVEFADSGSDRVDILVRLRPESVQ